ALECVFEIDGIRGLREVVLGDGAGERLRADAARGRLRVWLEDLRAQRQRRALSRVAVTPHRHLLVARPATRDDGIDVAGGSVDVRVGANARLLGDGDYLAQVFAPLAI